MADNNADIELLATLDESSSEAEILKAIKILNGRLKANGNAKIKLGTEFDTKAVEQEIQRLQALLQAKNVNNINITGNVNSKGIVSSVKNAMSQAKKVASQTSIPVNFDMKKEKLINDIKIMGQQNSKLFTDTNMTAKYNSLLDNAKLATSNKELKNLRLQLSAMRSELKAINMSGLTFGDTLKKTFKRATELFSGTGGVMLLSQQLRQAWNESLNLDKSFTDLIKVQDELSRSDYPDYLELCNKKAQDLAATQQGLIDGATEFSKSGYNLVTSNKLTEKSTILSNVGEMSASDSAKAIISGVQAFDQVDGYTDVVDKAQALIDKYNEIGNTASITTAEIAQGVQRVGSVFADANTSVDEFIALLAAGNRQFQDADSLSLGLRTAALRIRGCKVELEQMGEETDNVYTSASELQKKIADITNIDGSGGVKILEADGETFRSIYDIFVDLSKVYKDMSDTDQSALLELIAGKHRAAGISATLNNMTEAQEIYQRSLLSAGSAQEEYDKYLQSSEASLNKFKASMIETYQSVINGQTTKGILDTGNATLQFVNSLGLVESTLKGFVAIAAVKGITALSSAFKVSTLQASNFGTALKMASNVPDGNLSQKFSMLKNIATASKSLTDAQLKQVLSSKALNNEDRIRILRLSGMEKSLAEAKLAEYGLTQATNAQSTAQKAATINTFNFSSAVKGLSLNLKAAFMSNPIGISIMALSTIIGAVSSKVSEYNEKLRETRQANMDAATSAKEKADSLRDLYVQYENLNSITNRTSSQEEQFRQVVIDITKALGDKASALEGLTAGQNDYTEALKEATKAELESQYATAKIGAKAAEEELKDTVYSKWDGSRITIQQNEQMTGIEEHIAALEAVKDILAEYEDMTQNGKEWEPVNWDENKDDMNAVVEYYNALIKARDTLVTADNADFLMSSDIYENINTTINDLSESVEKYTEQQYNALKLNYEWQNGIPTTEEEFRKMEESIINVSGAGQEFQRIIKGYLTEDFPTLSGSISNISNEIDELNDKESISIAISPTITSSISQIATQLEPQFKKLGEAYKAIFTDDGFTLDDVDNSMLEGLRKSFAEIEEEVGVSFDATKLNSFFDTLTNGNSSAEQVQQAFNDLATAYFYSTDTLEQLNDETADAIQKQLEELGVINAKEVVYGKLAAQEEFLAKEGVALADATNDKVISFLNEAGASETTRQCIYALKFAEIAFNDNDINVKGKVDKLGELAKAYGDTATAALAASAADRVKNGEGDYNDILNEMVANFNASLGNIEIDFKGVGKSGASKAGSSAGDAYVEAYEKEVKKLDDLKSQGKITEKQYLDYLRKLYEKYFKNIGKYAEKFAEEQAKYLSGLKSLYESALSGITSMLSKQMDSYSDQKDAAVDALEKQKEAAIDALEAERDSRIKVLEIQRKQIEEQIKAKQKIIDSIREEIDAMQEANENRKKALDLQKAQYTLEKLQNQKTNLVYTESKGMTYQTDTTGIREAKQNVEDKKLEIEIANKEKQISLIEKEINLLEEQKDSIDEQIDQINEYYDNLIEQTEKSFDEMIKNTEKYWDELIKGLENYKSRWEELAEIEENAKLIATLRELGIETEDILGMSEEAFAKFKDEYVGILADIYSGNNTMTNALADSLGTTTDKLGSYIESTQGYIDSLSGSAEALQPVADALNDTAEGMDKLGTSSSTASTNTSKIADDMSTINTNTTGLSDNLTGISKALSNMPEASKFDAIAESFSKLAEAIGEVANTLGVGTEGTVGGLLQALTDISEISLGGEDGQGNGIISQFNSLKSAVEGVSSAISGGSTGTSDGASASSSPSMSAGATDGSAGGLTGAIDAMKKATDEALGSGSGEDTEGEGTGAIGQFDQLKQAVDDVTTAIGSSEDGENTAEEDAANLIGAIDNLGTKTEEILVGGEDGGESGGVIGRFTEFKDVIGEANEHVTGISEGLTAIDGQEVECTIKVNIETTGGLPVGLAKSTGTALDTMNLESAEYNAKYGKAHAEGTALVSGNWAVQSNEKQALLGELGYEIIVRDGRFFTVGENGAEMFPIKRGDIVFNHEQSEQLLKNGRISGRGKAYADGNVGNTPIISIPDTFVLGRDGFEGMAGINLFNDFINSVATPMLFLDKNVDNIRNNVNSINNKSSQQQVSFSTGDIIVQGVQNVDGFAKAVKTHFPNAMLQAVNVTR